MWLSPLTWLFCAFALALLATFSGKLKRWLVAAALLLGCTAWLAMTPLAANSLLRWLEEPQTPSCTTLQTQWAVVLAGGSDFAEREEDTQVLGLATRRRLDAGVDWWRQQPGRRYLAVSGGPMGGAPVADADVMLTYLLRQGVPAERIAVERASYTTWENARRLAELQPALPRALVLVTSASHMPRALFAMRQAGFQPCALPTDRRLASIYFPGMLFPQSGSMEKTEAALHEIVGMQYYRWLARSPRAAHGD